MIGVRGLALDTIGDVQFRGATLEEIGAVYVRDASGPQLVWSRASTMTVAIPEFAYGYSAVLTSVTSEVVAAAVEGGAGGLSYLWEGVIDASGWDILTPTDSSTRFRSSVAEGESVTATFKVTVTDALGQAVESNEVSVTVANVGTGDV
jgi:hypothetical protein